jgi:hypothetical protein
MFYESCRKNISFLRQTLKPRLVKPLFLLFDSLTYVNEINVVLTILILYIREDIISKINSFSIKVAKYCLK